MGQWQVRGRPLNGAKAQVSVPTNLKRKRPILGECYTVCKYFKNKDNNIQSNSLAAQSAPTPAATGNAMPTGNPTPKGKHVKPLHITKVIGNAAQNIKKG